MKVNFKSILLAVCLPILLVACTNANKKDDSTTEDNQDVISTEIPFADPYIMLHDNVYYAYGTSSDRGFEVYYSDNLEAWRKHPQLLLDKKDSYADRWFWAPEVYYNKENNKFYLFYSADEHICVATSDSPLGPFSQSDKRPMREEKGIDSSLFIDADGTPYIFFVRFTDGNVIWVAELEKDWTTIKEETLKQCITVSEPWETSLGKVAEGPSVINIDGTYHMIYSANDFQSQDYGVGYATADSPYGPWRKSTDNPILQKPQNGLLGTGHGAYFKDKEGNYKYVFHAHHDEENIHPRLMYIVDMEINKEGVKMNEESIKKPYVIK